MAPTSQLLARHFFSSNSLLPTAIGLAHIHDVKSKERKNSVLINKNTQVLTSTHFALCEDATHLPQNDSSTISNQTQTTTKWKWKKEDDSIQGRNVNKNKIQKSTNLKPQVSKQNNIT